jgi:hypothetical protein
MTSPAPRTVVAPDVTDKLLRDRPVWGPFIGGAFIDGTAVATIPVLEASTGTRLADLVTADADIVDHAVKDARRAYEETWRDLSPKERGDLLRKVAALIREHADELAELVAREVGKPMRDALRVDIVSSTKARSSPASTTNRTAWWQRSFPSTGRRSTSPRSAHPRWPWGTRSSSSPASRRH